MSLDETHESIETIGSEHLAVDEFEKYRERYEKLASDVKQDFPQEPQYGEALGAGHQRGGDFLFEVRRY